MRAGRKHVAIIGAGFSGTLQAINLLRHDGPDATLIERRAHAARGVAYSAAHPHHLLNVRAGKMSAFPDRDDHFVRWLEAQDRGGSASTFVPRLTYGDYLSSLLDEAAAGAGDRLARMQSNVVDLEQAGDGWILHFDDGRSLSADLVVLALGNLPPHDPPELGRIDLPESLYRHDPWSSGLAAGLRADDQVLLLGTGLTMVDVALLLEAEGFQGRILAMSRRGLAPRVHADTPPVPELTDRPPVRASALLAAVRGHAEAIGWRPAVDALRPWTQSLWRAASRDEQRRFLRHLRPWWDVHRHRIAPEIAARLDRLRASGRLDIFGGRIRSVEEEARRVRVELRPRGSDNIRTLHVARIVNCTGPQGDLLRSDEPLLRSLLAKGMIRPDPHRLGLDVTTQAQTVDRTGTPSLTLLAIGPMTRGAFWEIVAVPDLRVQTWSVARYLSNAHWVGGEGL